MVLRNGGERYRPGNMKKVLRTEVASWPRKTTGKSLNGNRSFALAA